MADDPVKMGRTDEFEQSYGSAPAIHDQLLETPHGAVMTRNAPGYSTLLVDSPVPARRRVALLLYDPAVEGCEAGVGLIAQMTADQARLIAGSLLRLAARIDTGRAH